MSSPGIDFGGGAVGRIEQVNSIFHFPAPAVNYTRLGSSRRYFSFSSTVVSISRVSSACQRIMNTAVVFNSNLIMVSFTELVYKIDFPSGFHCCKKSLPGLEMIVFIFLSSR